MGDAETLIHPPQRIIDTACVTDSLALLAAAHREGSEFWARHARSMEWQRPWERTLDWTFPHHRWFVGGKTNISINCFDRHLRERGPAPALTAISEGGRAETFTYREMLSRICRIANVLKGAGISRGDRVVIYMPLIVDGIAAMHACARIGAIHSVVYAGIGAGALRERILDCKAKALLYATVSIRRGQRRGLTEIVATATEGMDDLLIFGLARDGIAPDSRHTNLAAAMADASDWVDAEPMDAEDSLFILYTSGTTGKPKGVVHVHGGYQVAVDWFARHLFEIGPGRGAWLSCSDIGWIVGHSYLAYGPFLAGGHQIIREGAPDWPQPDALWRIVDEHGVSGMFVSPTLLRMYMRAGRDCVAGTSRRSLRIIASAGEPLSGEVHRWATQNLLADSSNAQPFGCLLDNFWQTEIASPLIATFPAMTAKASYAGVAMPSVDLRIVRPDGSEASPGKPVA